MLLRHLAQAERHVSLGERHIARQKEIILILQNGGHDVGDARGLLKQFEELQALHVADRDRLLKMSQEPSLS